jgi:hypothetical protein
MIRVLIASLAVLGALSSTATAAELRLERLGTQHSVAVASGEHRTSAFLSSAGRLVVGSAGRSGRTVAVPVGCTPVAAAARAIALTCATSVDQQIAVYDLDRGVTVPLTMPAGLSGAISHLGARWAMVDASSSPDGLHSLATRFVIDWRTQRTVSLGRTDPFGARRYVDLDAATASRRLCAPLRRRVAGGIEDIKYLALERIGRWTINFTPMGAAYVQRCATLSRRRLPRVSSPVLGTDFVGYLQNRRVVYLDLRTGRRLTRAWPTSQAPRLAAAGRRLLISAPEQADSYPPAQQLTYRIYRTR